jgi:hypothetical protein
MQKGRTGGFGHAGLDSCSCASGSVVPVYSLCNLLQMSGFQGRHEQGASVNIISESEVGGALLC